MKNKLIKAINEIYFREIAKLSVLDNINFPITLESCNDVYNEIIVDDELILWALPTEFTKMVKDLVLIDEDQWSPLSKIAHDVIEDKEILSQRFSSKFVPTFLAGQAAKLLANLSDESYFVGGCVRDSILGKNPKDIDFCTDTPIEDVANAFKANGWKCDEVGLQFLVLFVSYDDETFEIANFRKDKNNEGGEIGTMADDAQRRDFTVNAGYVRIKDHKLFDPNGTFVDDMNSRTLKFVGKAKDRLDEDPIRAMRFYRFMTRGFTADKKSLQAVRERMQNDSKRITQLQKVLTLPGVKEAVELSAQRSDKMVPHQGITISFDKLTEDLLQLERMRLEVEKMVGL